MDKDTFNNYYLIKEEYDKINLEKTEGQWFGLELNTLSMEKKVPSLSLEKKKNPVK